jgi:ankyrin repeat protein
MERHSVLRSIVVFALLASTLSSLAASKLPSEVKQMLRLGDYESAAHLLTRGVQEQDPDQTFELARLYRQDLIRAPRSDSALRLMEQAASAGHREAMYQAARIHQRGEGVDKNPDAARAWLEQAAKLGHVKAANSLNKSLSPAASTPSMGIERAIQSCNHAAISQALIHTEHIQPSWVFGIIGCGGPESLFRQLLSAGAQIDLQDDAGNIALHKAVACEAVAAVKVLLDAGSNPNAKNAQGWSPAMLAERSSNEEVRKALNVRADSRTNRTNLSSADQHARYRGWPLLSIAAWEGDEQLVQSLLSAREDVNESDPAGVSALHRALQRQELSIATLLLNAGASASADDLPLLRDLEDRTLLAQIVDVYGNLGMANDLYCYGLRTSQSALLSVSRERKVAPPEVCDDLPTLILAAKTGDSALFSFVMDSAENPDATDAQGCSALCWALRRGYGAIAHTLIEQGALNVADAGGVTPLMLAAEIGDLQSIRLLVERGAELNQQSRSGTHALLLATSAGHTEAVKFMLANGAEVDLKNQIGDTALIASIKQDHMPVAKLLLEGGASTRARNAKFENARELLLAKDAGWHELAQADTGLWGLVN